MKDGAIRLSQRPAASREPRGFLSRLARDVHGNTLAMMAAFLIPLCALAGSAVDMARLYVVKARLQQACDAGALAGRKFMTSSASTTLNATATAQAKAFFANNFTSGYMGTPAFSADTNPYPFVPAKTADQQVAGTATTRVPMTIMKMFGSPTQELTVTCEARYDVADTDIIFVLDTTGSMSCLPSETDAQCTANIPKAVEYTRPATSGGTAGYAGTIGYRVPERTSGGVNVSRMQALRTAVTDFYNTIASNIDPSTNIRYGFVTYSSMVNVGKSIMEVSPTYMIGGSGSGQWTYQSRSSKDEPRSLGTWSIVLGKTEQQCNALTPVRTPSATATYIYNSSNQATVTEYRWNTGILIARCETRTNTLGPEWQYRPVQYEVGPYVLGNAVPDLSKKNGTTSRWLGCIEERKTTPGQTTFNINSLPGDLDPDLVPTDNNSRWPPYWPDVTYYRPDANSYPTTDGDNNGEFDGNPVGNPSYSHENRTNLGKNGCAKPSQRLKVMNATDISNFVNATDFVPLGGTYHDIGMIWGLRLISPTGLFANDTAAWPGRPAPRRIIVFLTDGAMAPSVDAYSMYGIENLDRRVRNGTSSPSADDVHNARFLAVCEKAKSLNIDVWTVAIAPAKDANLEECATTKAQSFSTTTGTGLSSVFQDIAKQVAMLRISQ